MDLEDATTQEIYDELQRRNHTVLLCTAKLLDHKRIEVFNESSGSWTLLYGLLFRALLRDSATDVFNLLHGASGDGPTSDDTIDNDDVEEDDP